MTAIAVGNEESVGAGRPVAEEPGRKTVPKSYPIADAIRNEVMRLCQEGDRRARGSFTADVALKIMRVVSAGRQILMAERLSALDAEKLLRGRKRRRFGSVVSSGYVGMGMDELGDDYSSDTMEESSMDESVIDGNALGLGSASPIASTGAMENHGMHAIKELIAAAQASNQSPAKLVEAIAMAEKTGQRQMVSMLTGRLRQSLGIGPAFAPGAPTPTPEAYLDEVDADATEAAPETAPGAASGAAPPDLDEPLCGAPLKAGGVACPYALDESGKCPRPDQHAFEISTSDQAIIGGKTIADAGGALHAGLDGLDTATSQEGA